MIIMIQMMMLCWWLMMKGIHNQIRNNRRIKFLLEWWCSFFPFIHISCDLLIRYGEDHHESDDVMHDESNILLHFIPLNLEVKEEFLSFFILPSYPTLMIFFSLLKFLSHFHLISSHLMLVKWHHGSEQNSFRWRDEEDFKLILMFFLFCLLWTAKKSICGEEKEKESQHDSNVSLDSEEFLFLKFLVSDILMEITSDERSVEF